LRRRRNAPPDRDIGTGFRRAAGPVTGRSPAPKRSSAKSRRRWQVRLVP
jgi:hypothetical protein